MDEFGTDDAVEPIEVEADDSGKDHREPEDRILAEDGCGRAPEGSHWL